MVALRRVMRRRALNQGGSISRWFVPRRFYTAVPSIVQEATPESEAGLENSQPSAQAGGVEDSVRQDTSPANEKGVIETQNTPARRPLPLSPLMDTAYLAAKQKYKLPKAASDKNLTPLQQQLAKNPYAQALDTPVRMCPLTFTHLPSFFLQDFELIAHPSTNEPWYLPRSLTSAHSSSSILDENSYSDSLQPVGIRRGARFYVLSRASLLRAMSTKNSGFTYVDGRFALNQYKKFKAFRQMKTRWRSDMDVLVLDLMRRRIVEGLKYLYGRKVGYLRGCSDWDDAKGSKQMGAFLWLGLRDGRRGMAVDGVRGQSNDQGGDVTVGQVEEQVVDKVEDMPSSQLERWTQESISSVAPGEFATLDVGKEMKSKVPVHNLQLLLGTTLIEDLRRDMPKIFKNEVVALKHRRATLDVQLHLWKLQGYLAEYKEVDDE